MNRNINVKYFLLILFVYLLIFQNLLQTYFGVFQYFDEFLSLLVIPVFLFSPKKKKISLKNDNVKILILLFIFLGIGIVSTLNNKIQTMSVVLTDMLLISKFFMVYYLSSIIWSKQFIEKFSKKINFHARFLIYLLFLLTILNYIFVLWPSSYRYGIMANQLFYGHQTNLVSVSVFLISLLLLTNSYDNGVGNTRNSKLELLFSIIVIISTLRLKGIGIAVMIDALVIYVLKTKKKFSLSKIGILSVIIIIFAWNQISYYYFDTEGSARNLLTIKSVEVAKDYFPLGSGYATFASHMSAVNYSPLYYRYGLYKVQGITRDNTAFVSDTFWPMILGQFGFFGTVIYVLILFIIFKKIQKEFSINNINLYLAKMCCFAYLIISSTSESAFAHPIAIPFALIIGIATIEGREKINENRYLNVS